MVVIYHICGSLLWSTPILSPLKMQPRVHIVINESAQQLFVKSLVLHLLGSLLLPIEVASGVIIGSWVLRIPPSLEGVDHRIGVFENGCNICAHSPDLILNRQMKSNLLLDHSL